MHTYILLVVLVFSIAEYFYELYSKNTQIYYTPKCLISYNYTTAFFSAAFLLISHKAGKEKR